MIEMHITLHYSDMDSDGSLLSVGGEKTRTRTLKVTAYGCRYELRYCLQLFRLAASTTATLTPIRVMLSDHYSLRSHYSNRPRDSKLRPFKLETVDRSSE